MLTRDLVLSYLSLALALVIVVIAAVGLMVFMPGSSAPVAKYENSVALLSGERSLYDRGIDDVTGNIADRNADVSDELALNEVQQSDLIESPATFAGETDVSDVSNDFAEVSVPLDFAEANILSDFAETPDFAEVNIDADFAETNVEPDLAEASVSTDFAEATDFADVNILTDFAEALDFADVNILTDFAEAPDFAEVNIDAGFAESNVETDLAEASVSTDFAEATDFADVNDLAELDREDLLADLPPESAPVIQPVAMIDDVQTRTAAMLEKEGIELLTAQGLHDKMEYDWHGVIVDVGARSSFLSSHILGSINIPENRVAELAPVVLPDKHTTIVVYCGSRDCTASIGAARAFKRAGYSDVSNFWGGMKDWVAMGFSTSGSEVAGK